MNGEVCQDRGKEKRKKTLTKTTEKFVKEAKRIHKNYYDHSSVIYEGAHVNVNIICPEHGVFPQPPTSHLAGKGCKKCGLIEGAKKKDTQTSNSLKKQFPFMETGTTTAK